MSISDLVELFDQPEIIQRKIHCIRKNFGKSGHPDCCWRVLSQKKFRQLAFQESRELFGLILPVLKGFLQREGLRMSKDFKTVWIGDSKIIQAQKCLPPEGIQALFDHPLEGRFCAKALDLIYCVKDAGVHSHSPDSFLMQMERVKVGAEEFSNLIQYAESQLAYEVDRYRESLQPSHLEKLMDIYLVSGHSGKNGSGTGKKRHKIH